MRKCCEFFNQKKFSWAFSAIAFDKLPITILLLLSFSLLLTHQNHSIDIFFSPMLIATSSTSYRVVKEPKNVRTCETYLLHISASLSSWLFLPFSSMTESNDFIVIVIWSVATLKAFESIMEEWRTNYRTNKLQWRYLDD